MAMVLFRMVKAGASEEDVLIAVKRIAGLAEQADLQPKERLLYWSGMILVDRPCVMGI